MEPIRIARPFRPRPLVTALCLAAAPAGGALAATDHEQLEEIVVTGSYTTRSLDYSTGLDLSLRETPQSITVITRQQLDDKAITEIAQALRHTAGITVNQAETDRVFPTARGFSIDNIQFDGAPVRGGYGGVEGDFLADMAVYERVEVIRGAAGLLMGAGNPSAAINLIRKKPTEELRSSVGFKTGRWDLLRTEADVSSSLGFDGRLRGRFVGAFQDSDSYIDSVERDKTVLYGILEADLSPDTRLSAGVDYQKHHVDGVSYGEPVPTYYSDGTRTDLPRSSNTGPDWAYRDRERGIAFANLRHQFAGDWKFSGYLSYMDGHYEDERVYVTGFMDRETGMGLAASPSATEGNWEQYSTDLRFSGPFSLFGREHQAVVGWNASLEKNHRRRRPALDDLQTWSFYDWAELPAPRFAGEADYYWGWETQQSGAYASAQFRLAEPLSLVAGLRSSSWSHETWTNDVTEIDESDSGILTPYLGLVYDIGEHFSAYASLTDIYNFQTEKDRHGALLGPEEGTNYEIGLKGAYFDDRLNLSMAVFEVRQENVATPDIQVIVNGEPEQRYREEDGVTTKGYEAELSGEVLPGLQLYAGYTHRVARNAEDIKVTREAPEDMVRISGSYDLSSLIGGLTLGGALRWQSEISTRNNRRTGPNGEMPVQDSYTVADLFMRYQVTPQLSASLNVDNMFDKTYYESVGAYTFGTYGEPRNVTASVRWTF